MGFLSSDKIQEKKKKEVRIKHEYICTAIWLSFHTVLLNKTLFTVAYIYFDVLIVYKLVTSASWTVIVVGWFCKVPVIVFTALDNL